MKPRAFLQLAQQLSRNSTSEASLRTCVSRCYYALFNLMAQFINENIGGLSKTAQDHKKVYFYFNHCDVDNVKAIASNLNDLRDERNDSDYKLNLDKFKDQNNVSLLFMKANIAFNSFEKIIQSKKERDNIVKGIRRYKESTNS